MLIALIYSVNSQNFQLGVNLDNGGAFVNLMNLTNRYSKATSYDSLGWPQSDFDLVLMDGRPVPEWNGTIDDPEKYRIDYSGRYKCCFNGSADVTASGTAVSIENKSYNSQENKTYFDLIVGAAGQSNHGLVFLSFKNTKRTANSANNSGITKLIVNRPGYELNSEKIFTDEFITLCKSADFACYRFYNLQNIWDGEPTYPAKTTWDKRKTPNDAAQISLKDQNGKLDGWSWEYITTLSNILNKDIWINIHISCDSNYVINLAKFLKTNLNPNINIYIENSNEVWSATQATHGPYNQAEANIYKITFDQNYARRTVELSNWFSNVFGKNEINKRIRVILAGQHAYIGRSDNHFKYINTTFGAPKNYIYATSTALYFGSTKATATDPIEINKGMIEDINTQINSANSAFYRPNHINLAKQWQLPGGCTSYEGGPSLPEGGNTNNLGNQILAHRTKEMADILKINYLQGWKDLQGGLALYFTINSAYTRYGCWGITDDYTKPDRNYKMQAVRDIISTYSSINDIFSNWDFIRLHPNPITENSSIRFTVNKQQNFRLEICDILGINKKILYSGISQIGYNDFDLNLQEFQNGIYIFTLYLDDKSIIEKGILVR